MSISLAAVDLTDDVKTNKLVFLDVVQPVVEFGTVFRTDYLIEDLFSH